MHDKMRKRFTFHLGSHKPSFAFPPEDRSRYYDFVDTPVNWRPSSPLIERRNLTPVEEVQLRYACKVLCEMIVRGEIPPKLPQSDESYPEKKTAPERVDQEASPQVSSEPVEAHNKRTSEETNGNGSVEKGLCDSGIGLESTESPVTKPTTETDGSKLAATDDVSEDFPQDSSDVGLAQFYPGESDDIVVSVPNAPLTSDSNQTITCRHTPHDVANMTGSRANPVIGPREPIDWYDVDWQNEADDEYFTRGMFVGPDSEDPDVDSPDSVVRPASEVNPVTDLPAESRPGRTPSFSRPRAVSRAASKRVSRSRDLDIVPPLPKEVSSERLQDHRRPSQLSLETREDVVAGEYAFSGVEVVHGQQISHKSGGGVAVIIDTDGMERVMTEAEEKQRYLDLQRAVMEKMSTGVIGTAPGVSISSGSVDDCSSAKHAPSRPSPFPKSHGPVHSGDNYPTRSRPRYANGNVCGENQTGAAALNGLHEKKPGIMRKLSLLGLGKRKSSNVSKNANIVGFSRIVEAS
ncbi:hypothetical protein VTN77DRAFT_9364 [Rasamsonia byssochlamydoides]|uniref:uncharacterized protein n=1 Tax=Rasamsonia byssochlamydoides TaxID=89139 RepID=UPI003743A308